MAIDLRKYGGAVAPSDSLFLVPVGNLMIQDLKELRHKPCRYEPSGGLLGTAAQEGILVAIDG